MMYTLGERKLQENSNTVRHDIEVGGIIVQHLAGLFSRYGTSRSLSTKSGKYFDGGIDNPFRLIVSLVFPHHGTAPIAIVGVLQPGSSALFTAEHCFFCYRRARSDVLAMNNR